MRRPRSTIFTYTTVLTILRTLDQKGYVKRDGDVLYAKLTGQPSYEIFAESEDHFFWKVVDAQIEFANDGEIAGLLSTALP